MSFTDLIQNHEGAGFFDKVLLADLLDNLFKPWDIRADDFNDEIVFTSHGIDFDDIFDFPEGFSDLWSTPSTHINPYQDGDGIVSLLVVDGDGEPLDYTGFD